MVGIGYERIYNFDDLNAVKYLLCVGVKGKDTTVDTVINDEMVYHISFTSCSFGARCWPKPQFPVLA